MFEFFSLKETLTATMVLFAVIDIVGSIPIIVGLKKKFGKIEAGRASVVACLLMICFLFIGNNILKLIGVDVNSFAIAGAFVIFIIAIEMILGIEIQKNAESKTASIVPIAFPLIAGAGTLTTTLSLRAEYNILNIIIAVALNMIVVYVVLKKVYVVEKFFGKSGIYVMRKFFGIILLAIAVRLITANLTSLIGSL